MFVYVYMFALSVLVSILLTGWVRNTAVVRGLKATPVYGRHTHTQPVPRLGGIAIFATFLLAALAYIPLSRFLDEDLLGNPSPGTARVCDGGV
jgi:UDP-GlcNAc:undecaprenyl-phosphate/decaprenyl-phosphate GlcNAc-1-phosphate transferase